jgi:hypothetical protein
VPPTPTPHPTRSPLPRLALAAILLLALGLRLWGIHYGLPWLFYFHDEPQVVLRALRFGTGDLNPHFFIWPATLLLYAAFASIGGLFVVGKLAGWWAGKEAFAAAYFEDPSAYGWPRASDRPPTRSRSGSRPRSASHSTPSIPTTRTSHTR